MICDRTDGIRSARTQQTGIGTGVIATRFAGAAVAIVVARKDAAIVEANVSEETVVVDATSHCLFDEVC